MRFSQVSSNKVFTNRKKIKLKTIYIHTMAWINREPFERNKKRFNRKRDYKNKKKSKGNQIAFDEVYNTDKWKKLRVLKLMKNPLCEMCLKEGVVKQGFDCHHVVPILEDMTKAFDEDNLMTLCRMHHIQIHEELRRNKRLTDEDKIQQADKESD